MSIAGELLSGMRGHYEDARTREIIDYLRECECAYAAGLVQSRFLKTATAVAPPTNLQWEEDAHGSVKK